jgi:hypothetical protein
VATITFGRSDEFLKAKKRKQYKRLRAINPESSKTLVIVNTNFYGLTVLYNGSKEHKDRLEYLSSLYITAFARQRRRNTNFILLQFCVPSQA